MILELEKEVFAKFRPEFGKLEAYGFQKEDDGYHLTKAFMDGDFLADISVAFDGEVTGIVVDLMSGEKYSQIRNDLYTGAYVCSVRESYTNLLKDIAEKCFRNVLFESEQANRITRKIREKYGDEPDFPWDDDNGVFRNPDNSKWYALIMNVDESCLNKTREGKLDIVNLKIDVDEGDKLRQIVGIYPAYHMNHKSWITVRLDDTLSDDKIMELVDRSRIFTLGVAKTRKAGEIRHWIVPSNPKYFDIVAEFETNDDPLWKQGKNIMEGDIVYMYVGSPYSAIMYRCRVTKSDMRSDCRGGKIKVPALMRVHVEERYGTKKCKLSLMKKYGVTTVRGPRSIPEELEKYLNS